MTLYAKTRFEIIANQFTSRL